MDFATGASQGLAPSTSQAIVHALVMLLAWGVVIPVGVLTARFAKRFPIDQVTLGRVLAGVDVPLLAHEHRRQPLSLLPLP